jgi:molybdopterin molybdotransferase
MGKTIVASMPGNPLAAYVNAFLFLIPLLKKLQGQKKFNFEPIYAQNAEPFKVKSGRVNLVLGTFLDGKFHVFGANKYGSGMVKPLVQSNALWISDESIGSVDENAPIAIFVF